MTLRYVDGIQVLSAGKLIKTIDRRPLRVLPDNSLGVTFGGRVYRLQHRRIELTGDAWRKVDTWLLMADASHAGIEGAINPPAPPAITVEVGDRVWFIRLGSGTLDHVLIAAGVEIADSDTSRPGIPT
jgi:hypothetical protein